MQTLHDCKNFLRIFLLSLLFSNSVLSNENITQASTQNSYFGGVGIGLGYGGAQLKPDIFLTETLNSQSKNSILLSGPSLSLIKYSTINIKTFSQTELQFFYGKSKSNFFVESDRRSDFVLAQIIQSFGYDFLNIKIDRSTLHPFLGIGGFWSNYKDFLGPKNNQQSININSAGLVFEMGLSLLNKEDFFLTVKGSVFRSIYNQISKDTLTGTFARKESPVVFADLPVLLTLSFGILL
jgi:hypothetical protein